MFYVYRLIDPRSGSVFYVGKGQKNRIHQHEKDALKAVGVCSEKIKRIKDIWAAKCEVQKEFVAYFWDEQDAYDFETDLIEEIGLSNLTNILPGGQKAWARRVQERKVRAPKPVTLAEMIAKFPVGLMARFATWLKAGGHKGARWKFTALNPEFKMHAEISDAVYNKLMPDLIRRIVADEAAFPVFTARMREHGVEIV